MASKRQVISTVPKVASSLAILPAQQAKSRSPPPSPSVPPLTVKDLQDVMGNVVCQIRGEVKELLVERNNILRQDIVLALKGLASLVEKLDSRVEEVADKVDLLEERFEGVEKTVEISQDEIVMSQYREMEFALRIRGLRENVQEDLREMVANDIAVILKREKEEILGEIEKIFRINSWVAKQRNLPRDVVIYFGKRSLRNEIIQAFYKKRFQIAAQDVIILKETPSKILRRRKEFAFLSDELKKRQMPFRWDIPIGIVVSHAGTRHRLNTVSKAREFYISVLGARSSPSIMFKALEGKEGEQLAEEVVSMKVGKIQAEWLQQSEMKEQRMTRAAHKRKEKEQQKKEIKEISQIRSKT